VLQMAKLLGSIIACKWLLESSDSRSTVWVGAGRDPVPLLWSDDPRAAAARHEASVSLAISVHPQGKAR